MSTKAKELQDIFVVEKNLDEHKKRNSNYVWIKLVKNMLLRFNLPLDISYNRNVYSTIMTYRPLPKSLTIKVSGIEGLGLFATQDIKAGTQLGVTHIIISDDIIRLPLGGFINHTDNPNCVRIDVANKSYLHTLKDIKQDEEITLKYVMYSI